MSSINDRLNDPAFQQQSIDRAENSRPAGPSKIQKVIAQIKSKINAIKELYAYVMDNKKEVVVLHREIASLKDENVKLKDDMKALNEKMEKQNKEIEAIKNKLKIK
jgi:predicted  nucleic acid-binding Zn-ribbon protein